MKESLFEIFQRHRDCYDHRKDPTIDEQRNQPEARQLIADKYREGKQAASEYASSLIPLGNDWIEAVKHDVKQLTTVLPPSLHFNKAEREAYRDGVEMFLLDVAAALRGHGKGKFLNDDYFDPVTLYRLGIGTNWEEPQTGLSREDAEQAIEAMKQRYSKVFYFPDLFSMFPATWTVMGYKPKASTPAQPQKKADSSTNSEGMGSNATAGHETPPAAKNKAGRHKKVFLDEVIADQQKYAKIEATLRKMITGKHAVAIIPHLWTLTDSEIGVFKEIPSFGQLTNRFTIATNTPQGYNGQIRDFASKPTEIEAKTKPLKSMYLALINAEN